MIRADEIRASVFGGESFAVDITPTKPAGDELQKPLAVGTSQAALAVVQAFYAGTIPENGIPVCMIVGISSNRLERFVQSVAVSTGQPVDWHFAGGRAVVLALGDVAKVAASIRARAPDITALQRETGGDEWVYPIHWLGDEPTVAA